jgi:hypothetical protein
MANFDETTKPTDINKSMDCEYKKHVENNIQSHRSQIAEKQQGRESIK